MSIGLVEIFDRDGKLLYKITVDSDGHNIHSFLDKIQRLEKYTLNELYKLAIDTKFGTKSNIVVMSATKSYISDVRLQSDSVYFTTLFVKNQHPNEKISSVKYSKEITLEYAPYNKYVLLHRLKTTEFPNIGMKNVDIEKMENLLNISDEKMGKLSKLYKEKYSAGTPGVDCQHDRFFKRIFNEHRICFESCVKKISDQCLLEVFEIAPDLFDVDKLKRFYNKYGLLEKEEVVHEVREKVDTEGRYPFVLTRNNIVKGSFDYCPVKKDIPHMCMGLKTYLSFSKISKESILGIMREERFSETA